MFYQNISHIILICGASAWKHFRFIFFGLIFKLIFYLFIYLFMGRHVEKEKKDIQRYFLLSHYTISANPIYLFILAWWFQHFLNKISALAH